MVFCGAPPEEAKTEVKPTEKASVKEIAYGNLSEPEIQKLISVIPKIKDDFKKYSEKAESAESSKDFTAWLGQFSTAHTEIAGLDAKLNTAGMPWDKFWPAFAKTWMAVVAIEFEKDMPDMDKQMAEIEAQLKNPKLPAEQREMMQTAKQQIIDVKNMFDKIPQINKDLVKKYWDQLEIEE
jgi:hypothetical protein